jgi:hypothetical protein
LSRIAWWSKEAIQAGNTFLFTYINHITGTNKVNQSISILSNNLSELIGRHVESFQVMSAWEAKTDQEYLLYTNAEDHELQCIKLQVDHSHEKPINRLAYCVPFWEKVSFIRICHMGPYSAQAIEVSNSEYRSHFASCSSENFQNYTSHIKMPSYY